MSDRIHPVVDKVFQVRGTCSSYIIIDGDAALVIDPGDGHWWEELAGVGVKRVDWVLLTHTHRDQCSGLYRLDRTITKLAVPETERHLVEDVESFWRRRPIHHNYNQVADFFSLPRSVPVDASLEDFSFFHWRDVQLEVLPTPGHTPGSITLLGEFSGRRLAFTGDLIDGNGNVPQIHNLQFGYSDALGAELAISSLGLLKNASPEVVCPGHGSPIDSPVEVLGSLAGRLASFCTEMHHPIEPAPAEEFIELAPQLLQSARQSCSWYVLRSADGHALLIDLGYSSSAHSRPSALGYRTRFLPTHVDTLKKDYGIDVIDAVIITHYHDDHVIGVPYLQRRWQVPAWCLDRIAPILREPKRYNMPCLLPTPIVVGRTLGDRQRFTWRGIDLQMHDLPGQTDLHSGISFNLDGKRYLAMGDSAHLQDGRLSHGHIIFANRVTAANHLKVAERMLEIEPQVLLHGHHRRKLAATGGKPAQGRGDTRVTRQDLLDFKESAERLTEVLASLVEEGPEEKCRADWVRFEPYRVHLAAGESTTVDVIIENLNFEPIDVAVRLIMVPGVTADPPTVCCRIAPDEHHRSSHEIHVLELDRSGPTILCVDVTRNGQPLGWLAECQLWHEGTPC
jgi:glyoxylase-like metal-dependent hydrolase (beta-lactamase superfamily II)